MEIKQEIKHIDVLVHPDFSTLITVPNNLDRKDLTAEVHLRKLWTSRALELAGMENALLFYFPAVKSSRSKLESTRRTSFASILGNRFFSFREEEHPSWNLGHTLLKSGFTFTPQTTVWGYGEYLNFCVEGWTNSVAKVLGLDYEKIPELSLP